MPTLNSRRNTFKMKYTGYVLLTLQMAKNKNPRIQIYRNH